MSPSAASELVACVRRTVDGGDAAETAYSLVLTARTIIDAGDADPVARTFLARLLVKVAMSLDADAVLHPTTH